MDQVLAQAGDVEEGLDAVVLRAQRGHQPAFEQLLEPRLRPMLRFALAVVGDDAEARDAVQEACVSAWRELPRLREPGRFDAWLWRILTNACRTALRGRRRRRVREVPVAALDPSTSAAILERSGDSPVDRVDDLDTLGRAFDRLDPDLRIGIALHHLEGRPIAEVAELTGVTLATAKWRLHIGRAALERALEDEAR